MQAEDVEFEEMSEYFTHYLTYNAGTRVLFLNPDIMILEDKDVADPSELLEHLQLAKGFVFPKNFVKYVRKLNLRVCEAALSTPHKSLQQLSAMVYGR